MISPLYMGIPANISDEAIIEALRKSGGLQHAAAKSLGISQSSVSRRIAEVPAIKAAMTEIVEEMLDFVESKLMLNIRAGKEASIFFYLKCKGKERGWVEIQKIEGNVKLEAPSLTVIVNGNQTT